MHGEYSTHHSTYVCMCICALTPVTNDTYIYLYNINMPMSLPCQCRNFLQLLLHVLLLYFCRVHRSSLFNLFWYYFIILFCYSVATNNVYGWLIVCAKGTKSWITWNSNKNEHKGSQWNASVPQFTRMNWKKNCFVALFYTFFDAPVNQLALVNSGRQLTAPFNDNS